MPMHVPLPCSWLSYPQPLTITWRGASLRRCHWRLRAQGARAKTALNRAPISRHGGVGPGRAGPNHRAEPRGGRGKEFVSWRHACHGSKRVPRRVGRQFLCAHGAVGERRRLSGRAPLSWFSPPPGPPIPGAVERPAGGGAGRAGGRCEEPGGKAAVPDGLFCPSVLSSVFPSRGLRAMSFRQRSPHGTARSR